MPLKAADPELTQLSLVQLQTAPPRKNKSHLVGGFNPFEKKAKMGSLWYATFLGPATQDCGMVFMACFCPHEAPLSSNINGMIGLADLICMIFTGHNYRSMHATAAVRHHDSQGESGFLCRHAKNMKVIILTLRNKEYEVSQPSWLQPSPELSQPPPSSWLLQPRWLQPPPELSDMVQHGGIICESLWYLRFIPNISQTWHFQHSQVKEQREQTLAQILLIGAFNSRCLLKGRDVLSTLDLFNQFNQLSSVLPLMVEKHYDNHKSVDCQHPCSTLSHACRAFVLKRDCSLCYRAYERPLNLHRGNSPRCSAS